MSAHQMICHLSDAWRVSLGERTTTHAGNLLSHTLIKWIVLYTPVLVPKGVPTARELDQTRDGTPPGDFAADVETLVAMIERSAEPTTPEPNPHPAFGPLSWAQWARFNYRHMHHHLRQFGA